MKFMNGLQTERESEEYKPEQEQKPEQEPKPEQNRIRKSVEILASLRFLRHDLLNNVN